MSDMCFNICSESSGGRVSSFGGQLSGSIDSFSLVMVEIENLFCRGERLGDQVFQEG